MAVPVFMIERRYAEMMTPEAEGAAEVNLINDDEDIRWLFSFWPPTNERRTACTRRSPPRPSGAPRSVLAYRPTSSSRFPIGSFPTEHFTR